MKKNIMAIVILLAIGLCACGVKDRATEPPYELDSDEQNAEHTTADSKQVEVTEETYSMMLYTEAPNQNSTIKIEYPSFSRNDALNTLVYNKVHSLAQIDTALFPNDAGLSIDYQSTVTLLNSKAVSIIFWGLSSIEGGAYPVNYLVSLNIDVESMKEITFEDLYTANTDFTNIFFEKAFFPTEPITSYDKDGFGEMLKLQSPKYQTVDPFSISGNISFFLKPDGIVLSMPAIHATGNDHFEAQLKYDDIQQFYLLQNKYWE